MQHTAGIQQLRTEHCQMKTRKTVIGKQDIRASELFEEKGCVRDQLLS